MIVFGCLVYSKTPEETLKCCLYFMNQLTFHYSLASYLILFCDQFSVCLYMTFLQILMHQGVNEIFEPSGDFSGITDQESLYVTEYLHKAFINVNQNGKYSPVKRELQGSILDVVKLNTMLNN